MLERLSQSEVQQAFTSQEERLLIINKKLYWMCMWICSNEIDFEEKNRLLKQINEDTNARKVLYNLLELNKPLRTSKAFEQFLTSMNDRYPHGWQTNNLPLIETPYSYTTNSQLFDNAAQFYHWFNETFASITPREGNLPPVASFFFLPDEFKSYIEEIEKDIVVWYYLSTSEWYTSMAYRARRSLEGDSRASGRYYPKAHRLETYRIVNSLLDHQKSYEEISKRY